MTSFTPFTVGWDATEVARLRARVADTRLPWSPPQTRWSLGCDAGFIECLQRYWVESYDPFAAVELLNRYPQFVTTIDDQTCHYVHVRGEGAARRALLISHGWPGSFLEFWDVIEPLAFPSRHGGRAQDGLDVVIPSLPGFAYSGKPGRPIGPRATAGLFHRLMTEVLGYPTYRAQGGDWGCTITTWLGNDFPEAVRAVHLNMLCLLQRDPPADAAEAAWLKADRRLRREMGDYMRLQTRRPQSIAWAAADNPLGQAAWILERYHDWTDLGGRTLDAVFGMDRLITTVMLYALTDSFASAAYFYHAMALELAALGGAYPVCRVPTAFAAFPGDPMALVPPRSRAEPIYDLRRWTAMPRGGHFPAWQEPAAFAADVATFMADY